MNTTHPFPIETRVFFLSGGLTCRGTVIDHDNIEGLRFVVIKLDQDEQTKKRPVKLPLSSVERITKEM
ncbi:hypothetical protein FKP32DRAFT_1673888 [Trametes sanguinea]|nr:hypothetical protein FKP32DRAFT_1674507 [Trametes sanguinea]KAI9066358.1 hypothetical protein FKP32DRAFT_1673888 [Trametes sanguinea]